MRDLPSLIIGVLLGGFLLLGLLWLWFYWFDRGPSGRYGDQSDDQPGYAYRDGYEGRNGDRYNYNPGPPMYPYERRARRLRGPCYDPC